MKNADVAQSGGLSPVINASLQRGIDACTRFPAQIGRVFVARHGVEGPLQEELIDLSAAVPREEVALLRHTPSAGVIGGNDSMDRAAKLSVLAEERGASFRRRRVCATEAR